MPPNTLTLTAGTAAYLAHLSAAGKKPSTLGTAKRTLALLAAHLGEDKEVGTILAQDLDGFFKSEAATMRRGKPRAEASIAQLRRIVRAAAAWWREQGYGGCVPLPANEEQIVEPEVKVAEKKEEPPCRKDEDAAAAPPASPSTVPPPDPTPTAPPAAPIATPPATEPTRATCLDLTYQGQTARFYKTEVDRARLYGSQKHIALDAEGRECASAQLTRDGRHVLPSGATAHLYINEHGYVVARRDLVVVDEDGAPLPTLEPTTGEPQEIEGPLSAHDLLEYVAVRVHALRPESPAPKLAEALRAGAIFRVPYRPRRTVVETTTFLLGSEAGVFLVQAEPCGFDYVGPEQPALPDDNTGEDEDDIDAFAFPDSFGGIHDAA